MGSGSNHSTSPEHLRGRSPSLCLHADPRHAWSQPKRRYVACDRQATSCRAAAVRRVTPRRACLRSCHVPAEELAGSGCEEGKVPVVKSDTDGRSLGSSEIQTSATDPLVSAINHPRAAQDRHEPQNGFRTDREAPVERPEQGLAPVPVRQARCGARCSFGGATERHHGRLTTIEYDQDVFLELMELAVTWPELEYSETHTIPPDSWMAFVESHRWADPDRVERIFSIATDIVMTAKRASQRRLESSDCHFRHVDDVAPAPFSDAPGAQRQDAESRAGRGSARWRGIRRSSHSTGE